MEDINIIEGIIAIKESNTVEDVFGKLDFFKKIYSNLEFFFELNERDYKDIKKRFDKWLKNGNAFICSEDDFEIDENPNSASLVIEIDHESDDCDFSIITDNGENMKILHIVLNFETVENFLKRFKTEEENKRRELKKNHELKCS